MRTLSLPALVAAMMFTCAAQGGPLIADLSAVPASASIYGAWFVSDHPLPTGTGNISSFVRIGGNTDIIQGYNTDYRPVEFDELTSANFTRSLLLSEVPVVEADFGSGLLQYREFILDVNQSRAEAKQKLSLDSLQLFLADRPDIGRYADLPAPLYDLDAGSPGNYIELSAYNTSGSGHGDMFAYIPNSLFTGGGPYVYLYSKFGQTYRNTGGYEEWAVGTTTPIPEPGVLAMLLAGMTGLLARRASRRG